MYWTAEEMVLLGLRGGLCENRLGLIPARHTIPAISTEFYNRPAKQTCQPGGTSVNAFKKERKEKTPPRQRRRVKNSVWNGEHKYQRWRWRRFYRCRSKRSPQRGADIHAAGHETLHGGAGRYVLKDLQPLENPHSSLILKYCIPRERLHADPGEKYEKGPRERNSYILTIAFSGLLSHAARGRESSQEYHVEKETS